MWGLVTLFHWLCGISDFAPPVVLGIVTLFHCECGDQWFCFIGGVGIRGFVPRGAWGLEALLHWERGISDFDSLGAWGLVALIHCECGVSSTALRLWGLVPPVLVDVGLVVML